jgi:hypothetical protein
MSSPAAIRPGPFLNRVVIYLMPYFTAVTADEDKAEAEVLETLASYGARTRAELLKAVQIIAFSFSALEVLAEAKAGRQMPPPLRLRYFGCANALNRHSEHSEKTLEKRLKCDLPAPAASPAKPPAEPINDLPEADAGAAMQQAHNVIAAYRNRLAAGRAAAAPQPPPPAGPNQPRRGAGAVMQAIFEGGLPNRAAPNGPPATREPAAPERPARAATATPA